MRLLTLFVRKWVTRDVHDARAGTGRFGCDGYGGLLPRLPSAVASGTDIVRTESGRARCMVSSNGESTGVHTPVVICQASAAPPSSGGANVGFLQAPLTTYITPPSWTRPGTSILKVVETSEGWAITTLCCNTARPTTCRAGGSYPALTGPDSPTAALATACLSASKMSIRFRALHLRGRYCCGETQPARST